ncbi:MAG: cyclic pyranopterin monophosphate synthase MoaC [Lysobacteraceae bacterium]|nr:MAG: cyclic pyranopterin monophosphate synthase MoaC [Xanthomonadaceae bacterium]
MARSSRPPRASAKSPTGTRLTHVGEDGRPRMVDVGAKPATRREAVAEVRVRFPADVAATLRAQDLRSAKGPVVDTAIIAGTMAVKRTHELIPFCHPLPIEQCRIDIAFVGAAELVIRCSVALTHRTGVEMEALTGASVAALTVYDMCKALSHEIVIDGLHLVTKSGGKRAIRKGRVVE